MTKKSRNPMASSLRDPKYRKQVVPSSKEKAAKGDNWSRSAKHKAKSDLFQVGDSVMVGDQEGIVKSHAPRGLLGVAIDGKYNLVEPSDAKIIEESLARMSALADNSICESLAVGGLVAAGSAALYNHYHGKPSPAWYVFTRQDNEWKSHGPYGPKRAQEMQSKFEEEGVDTRALKLESKPDIASLVKSGKLLA